MIVAGFGAEVDFKKNPYRDKPKRRRRDQFDEAALYRMVERLKAKKK